MGVAALGMMMGQMQEANKDDYNMGAMLNQVGGVVKGEQAQDNAMQNMDVGSLLQAAGAGGGAGGSQPMNAPAGANGGGLGALLQSMFSSSAVPAGQKAAANANAPVYSPEEAQKRQQGYDASGSATNWQY